MNKIELVVYKTIKHIFILGIILLLSYYIHISLPMLSIGYGKYNAIASSGLVFFCLLYVFLVFLVLYKFIAFLFYIPINLYKKYNNNKYEHGMIALVEAFIALLSNNIIALRMFYSKARSILGDVPEVSTIKAYMLFMEKKEDMARIEFGKLLNYRELRLLAIKFFQDNAKDVNLENIVFLANKSLPSIYQPEWFGLLTVELLIKKKDWKKAINYIDRTIKKNEKNIILLKTWCLYQISLDFLNKKDYSNSIRQMRKALDLMPDNVFLIVKYADLFLEKNKINEAKKFLQTKYEECRSSILVKKFLDIITKKEKHLDEKINSYMLSFLEISPNDYLINLFFVELKIKEMNYSEAEKYVNSLLKIKDNFLSNLIRIKLIMSIKNNDQGEDDKIDFLIEREKDSLYNELEKESGAVFSNFISS